MTPETQLLPILQAANAPVVIRPDDLKYGTLLVGSQGSGKTAAMLRMYLNALRDPDAAVIVLDPKSELTRLCLALTPPDCCKTVWHLDLGRPRFGMTPLRLPGEGPFAIEATAVADNIVASLLDVNEGQLFQSSRRYLYHAVIGALALAHERKRPARFEDVYELLRPSRDDLRQAAHRACAPIPDLDQTEGFLREELRDELQVAPASTAQRLDAPRNKVSGIVGVPPLRRFFNHTTDVPLRGIVEARDVLLVDANMATIGSENARACMLFVLRMLHTQLQRQVHLPEHRRPRVCLHVDEAHYVASSENVVDQIATHRAAGLEVVFGLQYFAQLGSGSQRHEEKIRKGILNLLQSRLLFRLGDTRDAEEATRIAMAVYVSMIRDDPDSRARMRIAPESILMLPRHHCLASWIANGSRAGSFVGRTYALPDTGPAWAEHHLAGLDSRVGPYPENMASTLAAGISAAEPPSEAPEPQAEKTAEPPARPDNNRASREPSRPDEDTGGQTSSVSAQPQLPFGDSTEPSRSRRPAPQVFIAEEKNVRLDISPVRQVVGLPAPHDRRDQAKGPAPDALRDLALLDRITHLKAWKTNSAPEKLPRLYAHDYRVLALLDRGGVLPPGLIARGALPDRTQSSVRKTLAKLHTAGLVARAEIGIRDLDGRRGALPLLYTLTRAGFQAGQHHQPAAIHPQRQWREPEAQAGARLAHDLHALEWALALHRVVGETATDFWRTPRYASGRFPVPQRGARQKRRRITDGDIARPEGQAILDLPLSEFAEIKPDVCLELRTASPRITFDLLVEFDLTRRPAYNRPKFAAYDTFLTGWALEHPRYRQLGTRPAVVFVSPEAHALLALAREADEVLTGRIGVKGTPEQEWYYPGRDHLFFALEEDLHRDSLAGLALPPYPPQLRTSLTGANGLRLEAVQLLALGEPGR